MDFMGPLYVLAYYRTEDAQDREKWGDGSMSPRISPFIFIFIFVGSNIKNRVER